MTMLRVENVTKEYETGGKLSKRRITAVNNASICLERGKCLGIVGESGSGKSTLGRMIVGLDKPTKGKIEFEGKDLYEGRMPKDTRQALQMVYQNSMEAADPRFTATEIVGEPLKYFGRLSKAERREKSAQLLKTVGIPESELDEKAKAFSGGQLQRICIARAIAAKPQLVLLDEPLSSLDVSVQAQILNLLEDLRQEFSLTYLFISHDLEVVYYLADKLIIMYRGSIVESLDDMADFDSLCHPYTLNLLSSAKYENEPIHKETAIAGAENKAACPYAARCEKTCQRCFEQQPELMPIENGHMTACFCLETNKEKKKLLL